MNIATGSILNMTPADNDWVVAFGLEGEPDDVVCPVIGWATVVQAHMKDGTVHTEVKPAFVWGDMVWTETELREHTPGLKRVQIRRAWDAPLTWSAPVA
ncbi:hypothetical protein [Streptomyces tendae]|uniref:hypothetical protein n=1 Tax=Streptomyces tendae TaxID=1932 RepID=UPI003D720E3E